MQSHNVCRHIYLRMLRAVLKHVPSCNMFQIGMVCRSEKCVFLKHVSDWHPANFVISRADDNMSFLTITFEVALLLLLKNKQRNKQMQPGLSFGLFSLIIMLQDHAFIMRLRYDEVCTVLIWNMFQKCTFIRMAHHANLKHVSGSWHMFQNGTQHVHTYVLCEIRRVFWWSLHSSTCWDHCQCEMIQTLV